MLHHRVPLSPRPTSNKLSSIAGLEACPALQVLDLGSNRIERLAGLSGLADLRELWLGKNRISVVEGLEGLPAAGAPGLAGQPPCGSGPRHTAPTGETRCEAPSTRRLLRIPCERPCALDRRSRSCTWATNGFTAIDGLECWLPCSGDP